MFFILSCASHLVGKLNLNLKDLRLRKGLISKIATSNEYKKGTLAGTKRDDMLIIPLELGYIQPLKDKPVATMYSFTAKPIQSFSLIHDECSSASALRGLL